MSLFPQSDAKTYPDAKGAFYVLWLLLVVNLCVAIPAYIIKNSVSSSLASQVWWPVLIELCEYVASFTIVIRLVLVKKQRVEAVNFNWHVKRGSFRQGLSIAAIAALLPIVLDPIGLLPTPDFVKKLVDSIYHEILKRHPVSFISMVIAPAILEEMLFRGVILNSLLKSYPPSYAIFISSLSFAFMHLIPAQMVLAFIAGSVIGWIYWRTCSLVACIVMHAVNNAVAFTIFICCGEQETLLGALELRSYFVLVLASFLALLVLLWRMSVRFGKAMVDP